jgi:MoxR-like ATPase
MGQPTMLEGDAAVGKSFTIEYLAYLTNKEVYRLSLNGQTDTTDLIGKWVPNSEEWRGKVQQLIENPEHCETEEARDLIQSTKSQSDLITNGQIYQAESVDGSVEAESEVLSAAEGLTKEEMQRVAELEGIDVEESEWVWQDGEIPSQVKAEAWTVLDEMNTCEPQILVRLNSVLEEKGELVLSENGEEVIDGIEDSVVLATTNPPGRKFKGRTPLSREYISRFNYHNIGELPEKIAMRREKARLGVDLDLGTETAAEMAVSPVPVAEERKLTDVFATEWVEELVEKYTKAFYMLREKLDDGELARDQAQKFTFDQRDFHRFSDYIESFREFGNMQEVIQDAIQYCILDKFQDSEEREKAKTIAEEIIDIDEPEMKLETERDKKQYLNNLRRQAASLDIPEEHKELLTNQ